MSDGIVSRGIKKVRKLLSERVNADNLGECQALGESGVTLYLCNFLLNKRFFGLLTTNVGCLREML